MLKYYLAAFPAAAARKIIWTAEIPALLFYLVLISAIAPIMAAAEKHPWLAAGGILLFFLQCLVLTAVMFVIGAAAAEAAANPGGGKIKFNVIKRKFWERRRQISYLTLVIFVLSLLFEWAAFRLNPGALKNMKVFWTLFGLTVTVTAGVMVFLGFVLGHLCLNKKRLTHAAAAAWKSTGKNGGKLLLFDMISFFLFIVSIIAAIFIGWFFCQRTPDTATSWVMLAGVGMAAIYFVAYWLIFIFFLFPAAVILPVNLIIAEEKTQLETADK